MAARLWTMIIESLFCSSLPGAAAPGEYSLPDVAYPLGTGSATRVDWSSEVQLPTPLVLHLLQSVVETVDRICCHHVVGQYKPRTGHSGTPAPHRNTCPTPALLV